MEIKVKLQTIKITNATSGESFSVKTIRSVEEIANYIQESEKDQIVSKLEQEVSEVINTAQNIFSRSEGSPRKFMRGDLFMGEFSPDQEGCEKIHSSRSSLLILQY